MFEKRIKEISKKIGEEQLETYLILTNKKYQRDIYFQNSKKAISFIKPRFNNNFKTIIYFLLKLGWLQPFLKKIKLSSKFGEVLYVSNQIKGFDLNKVVVISFPFNENKKDFLRLKRFQKKISSPGFAPKILELNTKIPYSKEKLLRTYNTDYLSIFKRLLEFYKFIGIKKIPIKKYIAQLKKKTNDKYLIEKLNSLYKKDFKVLITTLHGDFGRENVLMKDNEIVFIDWDPYEGLITDDLIAYEKRIPKKIFDELLKLYPKEVKINFGNYMKLSKISVYLRAKLEGKSYLFFFPITNPAK